MIISAIKAQVKKADRVSVFVDGKYSFSLSLDQLLEQKLKKNDEITEAQITEFKKLSDEGKLKARTLEWLLGRPHSVKEFRDYLYRKKADKELIEAWVEEFQDKKYLNDEQFAQWFAENRQRKNKSIRAITSELYSKGISPSTIQSIVSGIGSVTQDEEALKNLVNKLRNRTRYQDDKKLISHLLSKGFSYEVVKKILEENKNN